MTQIYQDLSWSEEKSVKTKKNNKKKSQSSIYQNRIIIIYTMLYESKLQIRISYMLCVSACVSLK